MSGEELPPLKSTQGRTCVSKCHEKDVSYFHPVILSAISNKFRNSCAIYPVYVRNDMHELDMIFDDECRVEDNKDHQLPDELDSVLLSFNFNPKDFLVGVYDLKSFDDVIYWTLENKDLPFNTIKRVHNCAWKAYGNKFKYLSGEVLEYYYDLAKIHWLRDYINEIRKRYSFEITSRISPSNELYDVILNRYFDYDFFVQALKDYIENNAKQWDKIVSHYGGIKNFVFDKLIGLIDKDMGIE
jgi:hypothetical protein